MVHETEKSRLVNSLFNGNGKYASLMHANNNKLSQHELQKLSKLIHVRWFYSWKKNQNQTTDQKNLDTENCLSLHLPRREKKNNIVHVSKYCLFIFSFTDFVMTNQWQTNSNLPTKLISWNMFGKCCLHKKIVNVGKWIYLNM